MARSPTPHPYANCKPRGDRVVIKRDEEVSEITGPQGTLTLQLPDSQRGLRLTGTVVSIGPGRRDESGNLVKIDLQVGDRVVWTRYAHQPAGDFKTRADEEAYVIVSESDIVAVLAE